MAILIHANEGLDLGQVQFSSIQALRMGFTPREEVQVEPAGRILPVALVLQAGSRGDCMDLRQIIFIGVLRVDVLASREANAQANPPYCHALSPSADEMHFDAS